MRRTAAAVGVLVSGLAAACSLALNFSGIDDGVRHDGGIDDAGDGAPPLDDAQTDGAFAADAQAPDDTGPPLGDAHANLDASGDAPADGPCGNLPGPPAILIQGSFCIDSTEVTVAQYTAFLAAKGGDTSGQSPLCSGWNNSLVPVGWPPAGPDNQAVSGVNWCQAAFYCQWAGKRLCGTPDGGPGDPSGWTDPTQSQWFNACSHNNDGLDYDAGKPLPSLSTCTGGYPGLFDMSGNVFEWEDRCETNDAGPNDFCFTRGGAYDQASSTLTCGEGVLYTRGSESGNIGIRCCGL
jgi:hypothetical protein